MNNRHQKSEELFSRSSKLIPGGVNSPVRAFRSVGGTPFVVDRGEGALLFDVDGNKYIDYVMSWGPLILGHSPKAVVEAVIKATKSGTSFGAPTKGELNLASIVRERMPWIEKLRLVSSGTEACMTAARIARGATKRDIIIKFDGGYHGHSDMFLTEAGSGLATGGLPASSGVPENIARTTITIPYNDIKAVTKCFADNTNKIAAVIVEPVAANMGVIPPAEGFLQTLRQTTSEHNAVLIFDEVITGFRVMSGGAAQLYNIKPDLVCLGKILGGGLPIGAVGGRKELMDILAPLGDVYQAGTLSGNPLSTAAGIATLKDLADLSVYDRLRTYCEELTSRLTTLFKQYKLPVTVNRVESLFTIFFTAGKPVIDFASAKNADMNMYARFFHEMLVNGIYLPPSGFEAWFISDAHREEQLELTVKAVEQFLKKESG